MRGKIFQKPMEFTLEVDGETWHQGDAISGTLTAKNQGSAEAPLAGIHVSLAYGDFKSVRLKAPDAFTNILSAPLESQEVLAPQKEVAFSWKFEFERNCAISDTRGSLFLVYGQGPATEKLGQLQLAVVPYWVILEFLKTLQTDFRFVLKGQKSSKGWVELKLAPPTSKAFKSVEQLSVLFRFEDEKIELRYVLSVKTIDASSGNMEVKKLKKEYKQAIGPERYRLPSGRINPETLESCVRQALTELGCQIE